MITGFGNNVVSALAADITANQTTIQVMPGTGALFSGLLTYDYSNTSNNLQTYAKITLTDAKETVFEICHLTAVNNDILTVIRGQEGTTAKGWSLNDVIGNFATRGSENQFVQIEQLQSGHYISGVAGGTANALTLELPATYFVNGSTDWTLRTPIVVYPTQNNTGAATLQLTMGGRVLGTFKLYKGNKAELVANDILKDVALVCLLDNNQSFFNVSNPGAIYAGLGTAAFCDVTTSRNDDTLGRVLKVGDRNLGVTVILPLTGFDFNTYQFAAGETLFIETNSAINTPTGFPVSNTFAYLNVVGIRDASNDCAIIASDYQSNTSCLMCRKTDANGVKSWFILNLNSFLPLSGGVLQGALQVNEDGRAILIARKNPAAPLYIQAAEADGSFTWFIGNGSGGSYDLNITNYKGGNSININQNGSIDIAPNSNPITMGGLVKILSGLGIYNTPRGTGNGLINYYDQNGVMVFNMGYYQDIFSVNFYDETGAWVSNPLSVGRNGNATVTGNLSGGAVFDGGKRVYSPNNPQPIDLSGYATQNWVLQNFVQSIDLTAPAEVEFWDGNGYSRATDGAAMYNFKMVGGSSNVGNYIIRYTRKLVNNVWYVLN
ncbi:hypothetical protein ACRZCU_000095 [Citrobacter freundii]